MCAYISFENVSKLYKMGDVKIRALNDVSFDIGKGEVCVILGPSGAGKTTLLNVLGGMDDASGGKIVVDGENVTAFKGKRLTNYRRLDVGFVFQFYNLIPNLNALENVELSASLTKNHIPAKDALQMVGLEERMKNFPSQLSGGEQQRVSIARALAKKPKLLLCDEPTGALDYGTGKSILQLLYDTSKKSGMTVIIITHNSAIAEMADRVIRVKNGEVESVVTNKQPKSPSQIDW